MVGVQTNTGETQVPEWSVPTLKSRAKARDLPGRATLNWKVSGPGLLSVAHTVQVIGLPIGLGDESDGFMSTIPTVA